MAVEEPSGLILQTKKGLGLRSQKGLCVSQGERVYYASLYIRSYAPEIVIKFGALFLVWSAKVFTSELNAKFPNR